jgi:OPA family sugar phosphate sensor protein UhpC-like MFS transporter
MKSAAHTHDHSATAHEDHSASTLTLISLAHGINHAQSALKPLVFPLVLRELQFGYSELGIMLGVAAAVGGILQLFAGALGRILPRHLILGVGNASVGVCFVLVGLAQSYAQFFSWTVLSRVGGAAQHPVGSSLLSHHFHKKKLGTALATHFTAGNIGTAAIPLCAAILIGFWGWRATTILFAVPAILIGIAMCVWLKDPGRGHTEEQAKKSSFWQDSGAAIGNRNLRWILIAAVVAAGGSGHGIITSFLPLYLNHDLGMGATAVGIIFTLMNIGGIAGPMICGKLADRYPPQRILLISYLASTVTTLVFPWLGANFFAVAAAATMLGISAFGTNPILQTLVAQTTVDRLRDTGFAWFYTATFLAGALWSPAVGYLSETFGLTAAFAAMAASFIGAVLCIVCGRFHETTRLAEATVAQHG